MDEREIAVLVEGSEARAYASLVGAPAPDVRQRHGLAVHAAGAAVAVVARSAATSLNVNRIIGLGVAQPANEALIDDWSGRYIDQGLSFAVELGPYAEPQALSQWLRERRLRRTIATSLHYRKAEPITVVAGAPRVIRAEGDQCERVADICCEVFKMPEAAHEMISAAARLPHWRHWLAIGDEGPVGAALSFVQDGVAWLGWDATLPAARGRGVQSALIARRLADAAEAGCDHATTETA
ncbi:MAG TPA: GNAT family N-acetyltransferase, partial [Burkholderiaceae bacterium]|nr:GNAT family N-acetyltransferase [Burkholderiaceae bacterium]